jgi:hypothetical protein
MDHLLNGVLKFVNGMGSGTATDARILSAEKATPGRQAESFAGNGSLVRVDHIQVPEATERVLFFKVRCGLLQLAGCGIDYEKSFGAGGIKVDFLFEHRPAPIRHERVQSTKRMGHRLARGGRILDGTRIDESDGNEGAAESLDGFALTEDAAFPVQENLLQRDFGCPFGHGLTCLTTSMTLPSR